MASIGFAGAPDSSRITSYYTVKSGVEASSVVGASIEANWMLLCVFLLPCVGLFFFSSVIVQKENMKPKDSMKNADQVAVCYH